MSYAIITVVYGVPLNEEVSRQIREWEDEGDERWTDDCGFEQLYSASGHDLVGYCGVPLCELKTYTPQLIDELTLTPTPEQIKEAMEAINELDPTLRELAGKPGVYFIWSDS